MLLTGIGVATTSCEDMLDAENKLVTTDFAPQDTVYQYNGIIHAMQGVVDQTILLGELRADLVTVNASASQDLQELATNSVGTSNAYNNPAAFYNVINNCNIYLTYVDSTRMSNGKSYFEREIIAIKTFRAWCYLELAKIYGSVPFVTEPVFESNAADQIVADQSNRKTLPEICDYFIKDLLPYAYKARNNDLLPSYSSIFSNAAIPLRVMLGDLYLYRGAFNHSAADNLEAVRFYHDFLCFDNEEVKCQGTSVYWGDAAFMSTPNYSTTTSIVTQIPMDSIAYYGGTYTELSSIFNSTPGNNYYPAVSPSARLLEISNAQPYCYWDADENTNQDTLVGHPTLDEITSTGVWNRVYRTLAQNVATSYMYGDLRFSHYYGAGNQSDQYHAEYSTARQGISKYQGTYGSASNQQLNNDQRLSSVTLIRPVTVYFHLCEALNRAGFPETAFAMLKYGISNSVLQDSTKVSSAEREALEAISSYGFYSNAADWDEDEFVTVDKFRNKNSSYTNSNNEATRYSARQMALAALGSGDVQCNKSFYLPADSSDYVNVPVDTIASKLSSMKLETAADSATYDSLLDVQKVILAEINAAVQHNNAWRESVKTARQAAVDKMLIDQYALEFSYEGTRFYDLMRYSKYWGLNYLGEAVQKRQGSDSVSGSLITESNGWYLTLPSK